MSEIKFDVNYQARVLANLIKDKNFYFKMSSQLPASFFDTESHRWIYNFVNNYFLDYKEIPSIENILMANDMMNPSQMNGKENFIRQLISIEMKRMVDIEVDLWIQNTSKDYIKEQIYTAALLKMVDHLEKKQFDLIETEVYNMMTEVRRDEVIAYNYFDHENIKNRLIIANDDRTTTGWDLIDQYTKGGLSKGELGVIMAPTGVGKSFFLVNVAYGAIKDKRNVLYISLEMPEKEICNRMDAILSETSLNDLGLKDGYVFDKVKGLQESYGQFYVVDMQQHRTMNDIRLKVIQMKNIMNIDTLIIDYAGIIKMKNKGREKRWDLEEIVEELSFFAKEFHVKCFTAAQANRSGSSAGLLDLTHISEAYAIAFPTTLFITFTRTIDEKKLGTGRFYIVKNRLGAGELLFEVKFRNEMSRIHVVREIAVTTSVEFTDDEKQKAHDTLERIKEMRNRRNANNKNDDDDNKSETKKGKMF